MSGRVNTSLISARGFALSNNAFNVSVMPNAAVTSQPNAGAVPNLVTAPQVKDGSFAEFSTLHVDQLFIKDYVKFGTQSWEIASLHAHDASGNSSGTSSGSSGTSATNPAAPASPVSSVGSGSGSSSGTFTLSVYNHAHEIPDPLTLGRFIATTSMETVDLTASNSTASQTITAETLLKSNGSLEVMGAASVALAVQAQAFTSTSDKRMKKNMKEMKNCVKIIQKIKPYIYNWDAQALETHHKTLRDDKKKHMGVMAQELVSAGLEDFVEEDSAGLLSVDYSKLSVVLLGAVREQQKQLDMLTKLLPFVATRRSDRLKK